MITASSVRVQAARALWRIEENADGLIPGLIALLRDSSGVGALVATLAAETLGEMGTLAGEAVPVLRAAVSGISACSVVRPMRS